MLPPPPNFHPWHACSVQFSPLQCGWEQGPWQDINTVIRSQIDFEFIRKEIIWGRPAWIRWRFTCWNPSPGWHGRRQVNMWPVLEEDKWLRQPLGAESELRWQLTRNISPCKKLDSANNLNMPGRAPQTPDEPAALPAPGYQPCEAWAENPVPSRSAFWPAASGR